VVFRDRAEAGRQLGEALAERLRTASAEAGLPQARLPGSPGLGGGEPSTLEAVVLGLPRGGVLVAAEVAEVLRAPLDVLVVRKLGHPHHPELGLGAIGEGGVRVVNAELMAELGVSDEALAEVARREAAELERRLERYRGGRPPATLDGRLVVVVDDGIATGFTAKAAVEVARRRGAPLVVLAAPVAAAGSLARLEQAADLVVCLRTPTWFPGVGAFYEDFHQVSDEEVAEALARVGSPKGS
jgi:putative phosphoribosyl transferase